MIRFRISVPLVAACAGLAVAGAVPALASTSHPRANAPRKASADRFSLLSPIPTQKSTVSAGYVSEKTGVKTVFTKFEVPEITKCGPHANAGVGPVVILIGHNYFVGAGAEASCTDGATTYQVAINQNGNETKFITLQPKNQVSVSITIEATGVSVVIKDLSTGQKSSETLKKGKVTAVELGDDSLTQGSKELPIPPFTDHHFSGASINGKPLISATPLIEEILVKGSTVLITPGSITHGNSFVMMFKHGS